jgi:hypothetical protein
MDPKTPVPNSLEVEGGGILCTPSPCDSNAMGGVAASPAAYGAAYGAAYDDWAEPAAADCTTGGRWGPRRRACSRWRPRCAIIIFS